MSSIGRPLHWTAYRERAKISNYPYVVRIHDTVHDNRGLIIRVFCRLEGALIGIANQMVGFDNCVN